MLKKVFWFLYFSIFLFSVFLIIISSFYDFSLWENILFLLSLLSLPFLDKVLSDIRQDFKFPSLVWNKYMFQKILLFVGLVFILSMFSSHNVYLFLFSLSLGIYLFNLDERVMFFCSLIFLVMIVAYLLIKDSNNADLYAKFLYTSLVLWVILSLLSNNKSKIWSI